MSDNYDEFVHPTPLPLEVCRTLMAVSPFFGASPGADVKLTELGVRAPPDSANTAKLEVFAESGGALVRTPSFLDICTGHPARLRRMEKWPCVAECTRYTSSGSGSERICLDCKKAG